MTDETYGNPAKMARKGNPQHNARKRVARERAKAEHEAGYFQRKDREQRRLRGASVRTGMELAVAAAILFPKQST